MDKMVVVLEWDEINLGKGWMSEEHLRSCLFSSAHSKSDLIDVTVIATEEEEVAIKKGAEIEQPL